MAHQLHCSNIYPDTPHPVCFLSCIRSVCGALFRIRNTQGSTIPWPVTFSWSAYAGWSERASVSMNGANTWNSGGSSVSSIQK